MADEPVAGEPVSPCYSLFSPVMFGKTGNFPHFWIDLQSISFQVLSTFPSVMVFSLRCRDCEHSSAIQGYFFNVSGTLDLITGANSTTAKAATAVFAASSANLAFGHGPRRAGSPPCPRTNMGSAVPSGPSAGRQASKTKDFLTRIPPAVTLIRVSPREWQWQRMRLLVASKQQCSRLDFCSFRRRDMRNRVRKARSWGCPGTGRVRAPSP